MQHKPLEEVSVSRIQEFDLFLVCHVILLHDENLSLWKYILRQTIRVVRRKELNALVLQYILPFFSR